MNTFDINIILQSYYYEPVYNGHFTTSFPKHEQIKNINCSKFKSTSTIAKYTLY